MHWTGLRTYIVAALIAAVPNLSAWLMGVDWVDVLTGWGVPRIAVVPLAGALSGAIMGFFRSITTTSPAPVAALFRRADARDDHL